MARDLFSADQFELALTAVESVLIEHEDDAAARLVKAKTLVRMDRTTEARALIDEVLEDEPENLQALETKAWIAWWVHDWAEVAASLETSERLSPGHVEEWQRLNQARAYIELERWAAFDRLVSSLLDHSRSRFRRARALALQAVGLLRRGRLDEALATAERGIADFEGLGGSHLFVAVRMDIMAQRGFPVDASGLRKPHLERMRQDGYGHWVDRLEGLTTR